jgi:hypothetical protein
MKYEMMIGTQDFNNCPQCLVPIKGKQCNFANNMCNGQDCKILKRALDNDGEKIYYTISEHFYEFITINIDNPLSDTKIKFVVILKIEKNLGILRREICEQISKEFTIMIIKSKYIPDSSIIEHFIENWQDKLSKSINSSTTSIKNHYIRDLLNVAILNLELVLNNKTPNLSNKNSGLISESIIHLFEIASYLKTNVKKLESEVIEKKKE